MTTTPAQPEPRRGGRPAPSDGPVRQPAMLFPDAYAWLILVSAMDVMLTYAILVGGGAEVNFIADVVIRFGGLWGMMLFKFAIVVLVVVICEEVGRRRLTAGRRLAAMAVALNCLPVAAALLQLARFL